MEDKSVYFNYLEELRRSGETNMFGATPYLEANFPELTHSEAVAILKEWMQNYSELSKELGWDKENNESDSIENPGEEYSKLFDETIDKDVIDSFLKILAEQEMMDELDGAKHIWYEPGLPFIISFEDGRNELFSLVDDRVIIYAEHLDEFCDDFGLDFEETKNKIKELTGVEFNTSEEPYEPEEDEEEVYDYGTDSVIEDDFEEGE